MLSLLPVFNQLQLRCRIPSVPFSFLSSVFSCFARSWSALQVLERAYERLGRKPVVYRMNPKAMARQQVCVCAGYRCRLASLSFCLHACQ